VLQKLEHRERCGLIVDIGGQNPPCTVDVLAAVKAPRRPLLATA
jgi:hypothetical protein